MAGITIGTLGGENGIINKAKTARENYNNAKNIEELEMKLTEYKMNNYLSSSNYEDSIDSVFEEDEDTEIYENEDGTYTIIKNNNIYKMDVSKGIEYVGKAGKIKPKIDKIARDPNDTVNPLDKITFTITVSTEDSEGLASVKMKKEHQIGDTSKFYTSSVKSVKGNSAEVEITVRTKGKYQIYVYGKNGTYTISDVIEINNIYSKPSSPVITVESGEQAENNWYTSDVAVKIQTENQSPIRTVYTITGQDGEIEVENGLKEFTITEDGIYEIVAYSISEEGMQSEEAVLTIKRDASGTESFTPVDGKGDGTGNMIRIDAKAEALCGITEYKYYLNGEYIATTENEYYEITGLEPFIEYETYVVAVDSVGREKQSETIKFYTGRYLFNNGDECTELTGGWVGGYYVDYAKLKSGDDCYGNGFFNKNNNKLNFGDATEYHGDGGFYTQKAVDCRKYTKLVVKGNYSCYWYYVSKYPAASTAWGILFGTRVAEGCTLQETSTNKTLNHELLLDGKDRDGLGDSSSHMAPIVSSNEHYNAQITIMSVTSWNGQYTWYASVSEVYILR